MLKSKSRKKKSPKRAGPSRPRTSAVCTTLTSGALRSLVTSLSPFRHCPQAHTYAHPPFDATH